MQEHPFTVQSWLRSVAHFRQSVFDRCIEPAVVALLGPVVEEEPEEEVDFPPLTSLFASQEQHEYQQHRRLGLLPSYLSNVNAFHETSMSFATLIMLVFTMAAIFCIFLSCFYHNQKTSPLFISPRRHRLPRLVPPALPVDGYISWVKVCFYMSDEEILNRIGYDSLIFLRFHRLALRCIVKMSVFSTVVLLPLNFTGGGHARAQDLKEYVGSLFFTDFLRFTMANVQAGSPRLWVHCFAAYLLTAIVVRELLKEYETFNAIRHRYLLSREPHLRTVLVTNIPRHLRSASKITNYFKHVYPNAVKSVFICQNLIHLESLVHSRTSVLSQIEKELLLLCRSEKKKLYQPTLFFWHQALSVADRMEECGVYQGTQERLVKLYATLEELNDAIEKEQRRRQRVMKMLDRMQAGEGARDIDYVLASPLFFDPSDPRQQRILQADQQNKGNSTNKNYVPPAAAQQQQQQQQPPPPPQHEQTIPEEEEAVEEVTSKLAGLPDENVASRLRARSPPVPAVAAATTGAATAAATEPDGLMKYDGGKQVAIEQQRKKKKYAKARRAIKRYGRFSQDVSFLGKPIRPASSVEQVQRDATIEDHINEVTDKAFVVMRTFTAATIAIQSMHSSKPGSMQVNTAPEPRDILWQNIYMSKGAHRTRSYLGEFLVLLLIAFYVVPVALVSLLVSESALVSMSPRLAQLSRASAFFSAVIALVQPLCIVGLQQLLPPLFMVIGHAEGTPAFSEVQMRAFSRYFLFQVINVFLVTTIAGSIFDTIAIIIENPESAFEMLGNSLPRMSSFFITFVTIKTFLGLGFELVRTMALVQATARFLLFPNATLRTKRTPICAMRAIDDPGWFPFHKILAQDMLVVVISVVFAVVAPLVTLPCALFCLCSRILWTHHHLYVFESVFESGGMFWPKIFRRFVFGLIIAQMTITGQFILKEARHEAYATIALMFMTYFFLRSTRARYDPASSTLPLEVATVMDISLQHDDEVAAEQAEQEAQINPADAAAEPKSTSVSPRDQDPDQGNYIGSHDPFRMAYIQPALRANPRARPEQPFPVAQLGPEDSLLMSRRGSESNETVSTGDGGWHDSSATVRLKSMNQHDRRLIDRWWNDQLQRAGEQDVFFILIGEECGTLTISGPSMVDFELTETASSIADSHSFV